MATDPEHSLLFCREDCWHLTLITARPLKVLYFDGSSAAKMEGGPMDSQDIVAWGEIKPGWTFSERQRIEDLCEWGKKFDLDGFVRCVLQGVYLHMTLIEGNKEWKWICAIVLSTSIQTADIALVKLCSATSRPGSKLRHSSISRAR